MTVARRIMRFYDFAYYGIHDHGNGVCSEFFECHPSRGVSGRTGRWLGGIVNDPNFRRAQERNTLLQPRLSPSRAVPELQNFQCFAFYTVINAVGRKRNGPDTSCQVVGTSASGSIRLDSPWLAPRHNRNGSPPLNLPEQ